MPESHSPQLQIAIQGQFIRHFYPESLCAIPASAAVLSLPFKITSGISFPLCTTGRISSLVSLSIYAAVSVSAAVRRKSRKCFIISRRSVIACSFCHRSAL